MIIKLSHFNSFLISGALLIMSFSYKNLVLDTKRDFKNIEYKILPESLLEVNGKTNVNSFSCTSHEQFEKSNLNYSYQEHNSSIYFKNTKFNLNIKQLDCGKKKINKDLFKALKVDDYPNITIVLKEALNLECEDMKICGEWTNFEVNTDITITCETRPILIPILVKRIADQSYRITGGTSLKLCDFAVEAPTALMGLIKVKDEIDFNFDLYVDVSL